MKFSVLKETILDELQILQGIVEKRNTMPILANILVTVGDGRVEFVGTDLEVGLKTSIEAETEEPGAITISGKKIFEIVKSLPDGQVVNFKENDDLMMEISSGKSEFKVLCLPKEDYPLVPEAKFERKKKEKPTTQRARRIFPPCRLWWTLNFLKKTITHGSGAVNEQTGLDPSSTKLN